MPKRRSGEGWPSRSDSGALVSLGRRAVTPTERSSFLRDAADHLRTLDHERLVWLAPSGEVYLLDGNADSVALDGHEALLRDAWAIHNHPGSGPLSVYDLTTAIELDVERFEIVARDGSRTALTRPAEGWTPTLAQDLRKLSLQSYRANKKRGATESNALKAAGNAVRRRMRRFVISVVE